MARDYNVIGKRIPKVDGPELVTGKALYSIDDEVPGMIYGKILTSPYAHARIKNIDVSKAEALPGVRATLTYKDTLPNTFKKELRVLDSKVRYVGDEVAAVAADTEEIADEALKLIDVEYEVLPAVFDPEEALKSGAPLVYEDKDLFPGGNLIDNWVYKYEQGDIKKGFQEANHIFEEVFEVYPQRVAPLGRTAAIAWWEGDKLTVIDSGQHPFSRRYELSVWLQMPLHNIRVIHKYMGSGMGEGTVYLYQPIAAYLARKANRPVKVITDPKYNICGNAKSRAHARTYLKIGVKNDGEIIAMEGKVFWNKGSNQTGGPGPWYPRSTAPFGYCGNYRCANLKDEVYGVYTNTPPNHSYRAWGAPEIAFPIDSFISKIANKLGLDPFEYQLKYAIAINDDGLPQNNILIGRAGEYFNWKSKWHKPGEKTLPDGKKHGIGMGITTAIGGADPDRECSAAIRLTADGNAIVLTGIADTGMGSRTTMVQVAAETLGMEVEKVSIIAGDTILPRDRGSSASRIAKSGGQAVYRAGEDLKAKLFPVLATQMGVDAKDLVARGGRIYSKVDPTKEMSWDAAVMLANEYFGNGCLMGWGSKHPVDQNVVDDKQSICGEIIEVAVDTDTGEVDVLGVYPFWDIGQCLNPAIVETQITGGATVGIGYALTEDVVYDPDTGTTLNASFLEYKLPTILDFPENGIDILLKDDEPNPCTPHGQRGLGEPPCVPQAPAINAAIYNAIGVSVNSLPITPDKILKALGKA
jgi:CO/xanthine dehydrogenase Mo-binding subunit